MLLFLCSKYKYLCYSCLVITIVCFLRPMPNKSFLSFTLHFCLLLQSSVRTRRSNEKSDGATLRGMLNNFSTAANTKNIVKRVTSGAAQLLLAHAFQVSSLDSLWISMIAILLIMYWNKSEKNVLSISGGTNWYLNKFWMCVCQRPRNVWTLYETSAFWDLIIL